jgi:hypothetical protein
MENSLVVSQKINESQHQWLTPVILATQEDRGSKPAWANSLRDPISKIPIAKIGLVEWLKV